MAGRRRSRSGAFGNFSRSVNQPFTRVAGRKLSLLQIILIAVILYFLLRILLPLIWTLFLIVVLIVLLKVVFEML